MSQPFRRQTRSPLAWYGGSWAYSAPTPDEQRRERKDRFRSSDFGPELPPGQGRGVILGRFLPPHLGHQYLVDFARAFTSELTLFLRIAPDDPIPGELRAAWLREIYPEAVVPVRDAPAAPASTTSFQDRESQQWADVVRGHVPRPDYVFTSDGVSPAFTSALGARCVTVDSARRVVPIRGSQIRTDPWSHWEFLPPCVRPYYLRRVCLIGPESTGKRTLARRLAEHYGTVWVGEQARTVCAGRFWEPEQTQIIARGQLAAEEALARWANRLLFCDTDLLAVRLWSERLFGQAPDWVRRQSSERACDLYLVTDINVPYVIELERGPDGQTYPVFEPEQRHAFLQRCLAELSALGRRYVLIGGSWDERFDQARAAVDELRPRQG